jgi:tetratricopeptide (TPR) repeat protein
MSMEKKIEGWVSWIRQNQERFWAIAGTAFLTLLFIALLIRHKQKQADDAWFELGNVQSQLSQNKFEDTRKSLESWDTRFGNSNAVTYAKFLKADLAYRTSDYKQASALYGEIAQNGNPDVMRPLALAAQIASEEYLGRFTEAAALCQSLLDTYPDHFLAANTYLTQARLAELANNPAQAATIYERYTLLYPQSPWTAFAKARSQTLARN